MPVTWVGTRTLPLDHLTPYPGNARRGDTAAIAASLQRTGQYRALVVRDTGHSYVILAGNNTYEAMHTAGLTEARCDVVTCDDAEAARINLADNKIASLGADDPAALMALVQSLDEDLGGTGYDLDDIDDLRAGLGDAPVMPPGATGARFAESDEELAEREARIAGYRPASNTGNVETILVVTVQERDEFMRLVRAARARDGEASAGQIVLAALAAYAPEGSTGD